MVSNRRSEPPQRGRPAIAPAPRAGRAAADIVRGLNTGNKFGAGVGDMAARWADIVGEKTARMCSPVKLTGRDKSGVLHVAAVGPAAVLVEADAKRILDCVNRFTGLSLGRLAITRAPAKAPSKAAAAKQGPAGLAPSARLKLEAELAAVEDPRLKAALLKLGRAALQKRPPTRAGEGGS